MIKSEEIFDEINDVRLSKQDVVSIIKQAQSEAIEETVKACAEAAKVEIEGDCGCAIDDVFIIYEVCVRVCKHSILDVENQLKANL